MVPAALPLPAASADAYVRTMSLAPLAPLEALSAPSRAAFRDALEAHGFVYGVLRRAEAFAASPLRYASAPGVRWRLVRDGTPGADLARLFACDDVLPAARVEALFGAPLVADLVTAGLLAPSHDGVRSPFLVYPMESGPWIVSDRLWDGPDAAMGPGSGTAFVARTLPSRIEGTLLDVGCGAGSLAIAAAMRGASRAVGVDINRRAVALARFNAALNGVAAEFRVGDLTKPVRGERFDRVVAQPAFVARPARSDGITYLHGGAHGDELSLRLLGECPAVLAAGGVATVFYQAPVREGETVTRRIRDALGDAADDVDVLSLRMDGASPALQAMVFASYESASADDRYAAAVHRYLDHFDAVGTAAVDGLFVVLTKPDDDAIAESRRYAITLPWTGGEFTPADLDALRARLALSADPDATLLAATLRVAPELVAGTEAPVCDRGAGGPSLRFDGHPFGIGGAATPDVVERLRAFGTGATAERALHAYARTARGAVATLRPGWLAFVREALVRSRLAIC